MNPWLSVSTWLSRNRAAVGPTLLIFALLYVLAQSYAGRVELVSSQRSGCERGKLDRADNSEGWWIAERARMNTATDPHQDPRSRSSARIAAEKYGGIAARLEARASIDCHRVFPNPSLLPNPS